MQCHQGQLSKSEICIFHQFLTGTAEKYFVTPLNFFFKFSLCLILFPIFSVHLNWNRILCNSTPQRILRKICYVERKAEHEIIILYENSKNNISRNRRGTTINWRYSEKHLLQGQHAAQLNFCRYECLCPATKINPSWVFSTEFCEISGQLLWGIISIGCF